MEAISGGGLESPPGRRKVGRNGEARHVCVAGCIHGDAVALLRTAAAEIGGVHERGARGIELRHKDVDGVERCIERPWRRGEVGRNGGARHVGVAGHIHGDAGGYITIAAAEVGGVDEHRIDDQRPAAVIRGYLEADATRVFEHVATSDFPADAVDLLIDGWLPLADCAGGRVQHEIALGIYFEFVGTLEADRDRLGVCARANDEVVLELALVVAIVDEVDPAVDVFVSHLRVRRNVGPPLRGVVADEVVHLAGQLIQPCHAWRGVGADESRPHDGPRHLLPLRQAGLYESEFTARRLGRGLGQNHHCLRGGQEHRRAASAGQEFHPTVRLAVVGFEAERQSAVHRLRAGGRIPVDQGRQPDLDSVGRKR